MSSAALDQSGVVGDSTLNLKVPTLFKRRVKTYAAQRGLSIKEVIMSAFELLQQQQGG